MNRAMARRHHRACFACGERNPDGLGLRFDVEGGQARAVHTLGAKWQGYVGVVQGGVVAAVLDSAMVHCLFARGIAAVTARLELRYKRPLAVDRPFEVRGWALGEARESRVLPGLHRLTAEIRQDGRLVASAKAVFAERREA